MENFKVRCISDEGSCNTIGKIYPIINSVMTFDTGNKSTGTPFKNVEQINSILTSQFELVEENEMFTKDDLKIGYVVEYRDGKFGMMLPTQNGNALVSSNGDWDNLEQYENDLTIKGFKEGDILKVYGLMKSGYKAHRLSAEARPLLWERKEEPKIKVTAKEVFEIIAKDRGCTVDRVEIVGDMK